MANRMDSTYVIILVTHDIPLLFYVWAEASVFWATCYVVCCKLHEYIMTKLASEPVMPFR